MVDEIHDIVDTFQPGDITLVFGSRYYPRYDIMRKYIRDHAKSSPTVCTLHDNYLGKEACRTAEAQGIGTMEIETDGTYDWIRYFDSFVIFIGREDPNQCGPLLAALADRADSVTAFDATGAVLDYDAALLAVVSA